MSDEDETVVERPCAANVDYKDVQGACQRVGRYPDADGVRWWCGLHNPERVKPKARHAPLPLEEGASMEEIREALLNIKSPQIRELLDIVQDAQHVLFEISNTRDIGWSENTPVEKYRILMAHMADRAKEVYESLTERISRFHS